MKITTTNKGDVAIVTPQRKKIDASIAVEFKAKMLDLVASGSKKIILNLENVDFIDSSGLGVLVSVVKQIGTEGGIKLYGVSESVKSILILTRLDSMFAIHLSEKGALEGFNS